MYASAIHEAGHAVVGEVLGFPVREVAILRSDSGAWDGWTHFDLGPSAANTADPSGATASAVQTLPEGARRAMVAAARDALGDDERAARYLAMSYAGRLAQAKITGAFRAASAGDDDAASEALVLEGMGQEAAARARNQTRTIAERMLLLRWQSVHTVALELVAHGTLTGDEVRAIMRERGTLNEGGKTRWNPTSFQST